MTQREKFTRWGLNLFLTLFPFGFLFIVDRFSNNPSAITFGKTIAMISPKAELSVAAIALVGSLAEEIIYEHNDNKTLNTLIMLGLIALIFFYSYSLIVSHFKLGEIVNEESLISALNGLSLAIIFGYLVVKLRLVME